MNDEMCYVVRVKYLKDGTVKKSELMDYPSKIKAEAKFHANLAADMSDETGTLAGGMCVVLNAHGGAEEQKYWVADPEPVEDGE